jgi:hypothetical protein
VENNPVLQLFCKREWQCHIEWQALEMWLGFLTPLKWMTVGGGTVLSVVASATVLAKVFGERSGLVGGLCALGAALLTGLHTALNCDAHQAACRRYIQLYKCLESAYQNAQTLAPSTQLAARQDDLQARFESVTSNATAAAPRRYRKRAEEQTKVPAGFQPT